MARKASGPPSGLVARRDLALSLAETWASWAAETRSAPKALRSSPESAMSR